MTPLTGPVPLATEHDVEAFDCGSPARDEFLRRFALANVRNGSSRTYVGLRGDRVVGYDSLAAAPIEPEELPVRATQGLARHPIPMILLARLAVDRAEQGRGVGKGLLKDALRRYPGHRRRRPRGLGLHAEARARTDRARGARPRGRGLRAPSPTVVRTDLSRVAQGHRQTRSRPKGILGRDLRSPLPRSVRRVPRREGLPRRGLRHGLDKVSAPSPYRADPAPLRSAWSGGCASRASDRRRRCGRGSTRGSPPRSRIPERSGARRTPRPPRAPGPRRSGGSRRPAP